MLLSTHRPLPDEIALIQEQMRKHAKGYGLDFFETIFEMVSYEEMSMLAAFTGFPVRYPHWRFGAEFAELTKGYSYGLQKIYEMVINTDPCYAYLLQDNMLVDQKLVIAHVYGHCDFFKNNAWFSKTNRKMLDQMANHSSRVSHYIDRFGYEKVEVFIDACLSLENLIDPYAPHIERPGFNPKKPKKQALVSPIPESPASSRFESKSYMDDFINPPDVLIREAEEKKKEEDAKKATRSFPERPERDALLFLLRYAPLTEWQHDVLSIIRDEAYYFAPQGQTKIMNEGWACVAADTLVYTEQGLIPMERLVAGAATTVCDGDREQYVYDRNVIPDHPTITLKTRRGLELTASNNHRILLADGETWKRMDELQPGEAIAVSGGQQLWPTREVELSWQARQGYTLQDAAEAAGVSVWTVLRHRAGKNVRAAAAVGAALEPYTVDSGEKNPNLGLRQSVNIPETVTPELGEFLGYLIGDGHISRVKRNLGLTTGDQEAADRFIELGQQLFDLPVKVRQDGNRLRLLMHSETLADFLTDGLGLTTGPSAERKSVPEVILSSPKAVVCAFLRSLFDADGYAGKQGVILSSKSEKLSRQVQLLLLNLQMLSRRRQQADGCWHVHVAGESARLFAEQVGFGLTRKRQALQSYLSERRWFKAERWTDEVVSLEPGRQDVYDISVTETHRYAAAGVINHNSYWHSTIMARHGASDADFICYADHHSGTMATSPTRLNPYKLGIELFKDIEDRWNRGRHGSDYDDCRDMEARERWDTQEGLGREKIFEVRRVHNDVTFIDNYLTEEFCRKHKMFSFAYNDGNEQYEIASREFQKIKQQLLNNLTNHGRPFIYVVDGNFRNRGELYLLHQFQGMELKMDYAQDTLKNLQTIWARPVHIETVVENRPTVMSFDGTHLEISPK